MPVISVTMLIIGTVLTVFFVVLMGKGKKYDGMLEGLPDKGYSDKELWAVGYALQELPRMGMDGPVGSKLLAQANVLHPENQGRYAEYWARLYLARTLSLILMLLAFAFCICSWLQGAASIVILVYAIVGAALIYKQGANEMKNQLEKRSEACVLEFPNVVSKLAMLMNCGLIMKDAWYIVAKSKSGDIYDLMQEACAEMESGRSSAEAVYNFGIRSAAPEIRKFSSVLIQNIEQGGSDVTIYMRQQSEELWNHRRQLLLQKGDEAAAKLLIPTMMVLAGIITIIVTAAFSGLSLAL